MPAFLDRLGEYINQATAPQSYGTVSGPQGPNKAVKGPEPKVFLAAERTLLAWLRLALLIGTFSVALINTAKHSHGLPNASKVFGLIYALIGFGTIVYAWRVFELRRQRIANKHPGHFGAFGGGMRLVEVFDGRADELYGPPIIAAILFIAVLSNFIIQVPHRGEKLPTPKNPWVASYLEVFMSIPKIAA